MAFIKGQEVKTTVDAPAMWEGTLSAPAGSTGVITDAPDRPGSTTYGVLLAHDPDQLPANYNESELTAIYPPTTGRPDRTPTAVGPA